MYISGFTFVRNAIKYDYPVLESINSILPIVNEFVVAVGKSEDGTLDLIKSIQSDKIRIIETVWNDSLREGGKVLAEETDKALAAVSKNADWAFYLQADEVVHEKEWTEIIASCKRHKNNNSVEGLLFNYYHFYGTYDWIGDTRNWYRKEVRIVRPHIGIHSYKDAQGFRIKGRKLKVKPIEAHIYHYGWVKPPQVQQQKQQTFNKYWHDDSWMKENIPQVEQFNYEKVGSLAPFKDSHPTVMKDRISSVSWPFRFDPSKVNLSFKEKLSRLIEKLSGWRFGEYKNYKL